jgi:NTE family protein
MARCVPWHRAGAGRAGRHGVRPRGGGSSARPRWECCSPGRTRRPPGPDRGHVGGRDQRRARRRRPGPARWSGCAACGRSWPPADLRRVRAGRWARWSRTRTHLHPREPLRDLLEATCRCRPSPSCGSRSSASLPASSGPPSAGSPTAHWSRRCSPPARYPGCCRRWSSTASTTWTAAWCTASRSAGRSHSVPTPSTCCHVGRIDRPLRPPTRPWEVALVAFEIARRHRFAADLAALPPGVTVHVLPSGNSAPPGAGNLRYRDFAGVPARIDQAHVAAASTWPGAGRHPGTGGLRCCPTPRPPGHRSAPRRRAGGRGRPCCPCSWSWRWSPRSCLPGPLARAAAAGLRAGVPRAGGGRAGVAAVLWVLSGFGSPVRHPASRAAHYTVPAAAARRR